MRQSSTRPRLAIGTLLVLGALVACSDQLAGTLEPSDASSGVALLSKRQQNRCDNKYVYIAEPFTWDGARTDAKSRGGSLASISSAEEQACVLQAFSRYASPVPPVTATKVWINGSDDAVEGEWRWIGDGGQKKNSLFWIGGVEGTPYGYQNWSVGAFPNPSADGNCLEIYEGGEWNDVSCGTTQGYILRRP